MPRVVLSAENKRVNKKGHGIHSHDISVLFGKLGNKASTQLLNIYLFIFNRWYII